MKPRITILMASQYGYGPEQSLEEKKSWVENDMNRGIELLNNDFDVSFKIDGAFMNDSGKFEFDEEAWNKIYKAEMLYSFVDRGIISKDQNNIFHLQKTKEEVQKMLQPKNLEIFNNLFIDNSNSYDGTDIINFFEQSLNHRINDFVSAIEDQNCDIIWNQGGGNVATYHLLPKLHDYLEKNSLNAIKKAIIGFSDGATLPFYLIDKVPEVTLIQASGIYDFDYLKGERDVEIALQVIGNVVPRIQNIEGNVVAMSLHTSYHQMIEQEYVSKNLFNEKVVMLETSRDGDWRRKIDEMIENEVFDNSKAIILGEFKDAINGDIDTAIRNIRNDLRKGTSKELAIENSINFLKFNDEKNEEIKEKLSKFEDRDFDKESLTSMLKESFCENFARKIQERNQEISLFKGAEGNPIFGHGARKRDYISCSKCEITPENIFISPNIISEIVQNHEIIEENMKIERPKSPVNGIGEVSRLDGKTISSQEQNL